MPSSTEDIKKRQAVPGNVGGSRGQTSHIARRPSVRAMLIEPSNDTFVQFARYTVVGGVAFLADFLTLFLLTNFLAIYYLVSAAAAFVVGMAINYGLSAAWVFSHRTLQNRSLEIMIFAAVGVAGLGLNELGMWVLAGHYGIHYLWAKLITAVCVYLWNFGARKAALFR